MIKPEQGSKVEKPHLLLPLNRTRSPAGAGIANRPLVFFGIFLIFGSNTPTWSVENQLNLWATSCVVNQTGYFGTLYASRHQTSLWRHQHIYSVQLPQTGWLSGSLYGVGLAIKGS